MWPHQPWREEALFDALQPQRALALRGESLRHNRREGRVRLERFEVAEFGLEPEKRRRRASARALARDTGWSDGPPPTGLLLGSCSEVPNGVGVCAHQLASTKTLAAKVCACRLMPITR